MGVVRLKHRRCLSHEAAVDDCRGVGVSIATQNAQGGRLAGLFVRRPVLAVVINALIVVGGLAAFLGVEVRELPQVDQPVLSINTTFSGASADTVDREAVGTGKLGLDCRPAIARVTRRRDPGNPRDRSIAIQSENAVEAYKIQAARVVCCKGLGISDRRIGA